MSDTIIAGGTTYTGVSGIKATDSNDNTLTFIRPSGTKSISQNGTGIDVTEYAAVDVNVSGGVGTVVDTTIEIGENSVANASTAFDYLTTAVNVNALLYVELVETPDANNQLVKYPTSNLKSPESFARYRNGSASSTGGAWQLTYDLTLKQGTHYRVIGVTYTVPT